MLMRYVYHSVIFWMTLYWQNFEQRTVIETTIRFIPICIFGVLANILGSFIVARFVSSVVIKREQKDVVTHHHPLTDGSNDAPRGMFRHGCLCYPVRGLPCSLHL